nr:hypothetical protein [Oceanococcus sp. HetDA_MAG_MS8]
MAVSALSSASVASVVAPTLSRAAVPQPQPAATIEQEDRSSEVPDVSADQGDATTEAQQQRQEQAQIQSLRAIDREVRAHEQAHASVGGRYAGNPVYTFERGPDGVYYAIGGKVDIDTAPVPNDPAATIEKMQIVQAAALAPMEPSPADRRIASEAQRRELTAQFELAADDRAGESQLNIVI